MIRSIALAGIAPKDWRNGGGRTRELLCWPQAENWALRISVADIDIDGPFSDFPGVVRWFAVIEGAGIALTFAGAERRLVRGDAPLRFDGAPGPGCRLLDGPTRDLNLMLRGGCGVMRPAQPGVHWNEPFALRGLYAAVAGRWSDADRELPVAAHTLLWAGAASLTRAPAPATTTAWTFAPADPLAAAPGWWLGFTPDSPLGPQP